MRRHAALAATLAVAWACPLAGQWGTLDAPPRLKQFVAYSAEQQVVPAGRRSVLELRFRVAEGYHVNSHLPKSDLQIPTRVEFGQSSREAGVSLAAAQYPAGKPYSPSFDPQSTLDVYTGEFIVKLPVVAAAGAHELKGTLQYQACDRAACYPPKTLPLDVLFVAR